MTKLKQAAQKALSFCEEISSFLGKYPYANGTDIVADSRQVSALLREALAEPHKQSCACEVCRGCDNADIKAEQSEQEPVGWYKPSDFVLYRTKPDDVFVYAPLYAAPVRTKDLTDDEIDRIWLKMPEKDEFEDVHWFARAVIAADRELNK